MKRLTMIVACGLIACAAPLPGCSVFQHPGESEFQNGARQYTTASESYIAACEAVLAVSQIGDISAEQWATFRVYQKAVKAMLDDWHDSLVAGRPFNASNVLDAIDQLIVLQLQLEAEGPDH